MERASEFIPGGVPQFHLLASLYSRQFGKECQLAGRVTPVFTNHNQVRAVSSKLQLLRTILKLAAVSHDRAGK
jgi:hypothetical protein